MGDAVSPNTGELAIKQSQQRLGGLVPTLSRGNALPDAPASSVGDRGWAIEGTRSVKDGIPTRERGNEKPQFLISVANSLSPQQLTLIQRYCGCPTTL
jgi:hypothetical protein